MVSWRDVSWSTDETDVISILRVPENLDMQKVQHHCMWITCKEHIADHEALLPPIIPSSDATS